MILVWMTRADAFALMLLSVVLQDRQCMSQTLRRKGKYHTFWCQFNEKPSMIPSCPRSQTLHTSHDYSNICSKCINLFIKQSIKSVLRVINQPGIAVFGTCQVTQQTVHGKSTSTHADCHTDWLHAISMQPGSLDCFRFQRHK